MVFRRRDRRPFTTVLTELVYPRGGWWRAVQYMGLRLRRLPDPPHRIARGVFAGVFISFTPLFGLHFFGAGIIAWAIRGNILAALIATFFGNPVTLPFIAYGAVELGHWMLRDPSGFGFEEILQSFSGVWTSLYHNARALFTPDIADWAGLRHFFDEIFLPYLIGGLIPGAVAGMICYYATLPGVAAYQKLRDRQRRERIERAIEKRQKAADKERRRAEKAAEKAAAKAEEDR
ncbi:MAG: DUF2062 domain-containing protein [Paracoccaceae bacterium]